MQVAMQLNQLSLGKVFWEHLVGYSDRDSFKEIKWWDRDFMETPGDLKNLETILKQHLEGFPYTIASKSPLAELNQMWEFINAAQFICRPDDLLEIESVAEFANKYPCLYECMAIWAWG